MMNNATKLLAGVAGVGLFALFAVTPTVHSTVAVDVVTCHITCNGVDVDPPTRLDITGLSDADCLDSGGTIAADRCIDVDY